MKFKVETKANSRSNLEELVHFMTLVRDFDIEMGVEVTEDKYTLYGNCKPEYIVEEMDTTTPPEIIDFNNLLICGGLKHSNCQHDFMEKLIDFIMVKYAYPTIIIIDQKQSTFYQRVLDSAIIINDYDEAFKLLDTLGDRTFEENPVFVLVNDGLGMWFHNCDRFMFSIKRVIDLANTYLYMATNEEYPLFKTTELFQNRVLFMTDETNSTIVIDNGGGTSLKYSDEYILKTPENSKIYRI